MNIELTQKKLSAHYQFVIHINGEKKYYAKANRTVWPFFRKIEVNTLEEKTVLTLKQKKYWLKFIESIWIYGCPFEIKKNANALGWIRSWFRLGQLTARADIDGEKYEIFVHKNNRISIRQDNSQIGLIKRESWKEWDGDKYSAEFNDNVDSLLCLLFILFVDITWFTSDAAMAAFNKTEYIPIKGIEEEAGWIPNKK